VAIAGRRARSYAIQRSGVGVHEGDGGQGLVDGAGRAYRFRYLPDGQRRDNDWAVGASEKVAENLQDLDTGMRAIVTGRLRQRTYEVKDGGMADATSASRVTGQTRPCRSPAQPSGWLSSARSPWSAASRREFTSRDPGSGRAADPANARQPSLR
jgi:single-stranded DNA-binding protein